MPLITNLTDANTIGTLGQYFGNFINDAFGTNLIFFGIIILIFMLGYLKFAGASFELSLVVLIPLFLILIWYNVLPAVIAFPLFIIGGGYVLYIVYTQLLRR